MSAQGCHLHGPHGHEVEHAAQHGGKDRSSGTIAVMAAILATVGALFSYLGGATRASAGRYKNNAAIQQTEASKPWNFHQAKRGRQNLAELAIALAATALPTRRKWLESGMFGVAATGLVLRALAAAQP